MTEQGQLIEMQGKACHSRMLQMLRDAGFDITSQDFSFDGLTRKGEINVRFIWTMNGPLPDKSAADFAAEDGSAPSSDSISP